MDDDDDGGEFSTLDALPRVSIKNLNEHDANVRDGEWDIAREGGELKRTGRRRLPGAAPAGRDDTGLMMLVASQEWYGPTKVVPVER